MKSSLFLGRVGVEKPRSCVLVVGSSGWKLARQLGERLLENKSIIPEITMLFQQPVLYPHLNVSQNIALGAPKELTKPDLNIRIAHVLDTIGLLDFNSVGRQACREVRLNV